MSRLTILFAGFIVLSVTALFAGAGHLAANTLIAQQQGQQLKELAQLALRRTETTIEFGQAALEDLRARGLFDCGAATMQNVRSQVYEWGPVKDIRVGGPGGRVRCSAYSETLEFDRAWPSREEMTRSADGRVSLFRVDQYSGGSIGVLTDINPDTTLIAILASDTRLVDVMPEELQRGSSVSLQIIGADTITAIESETMDRSGNDIISVTAASRSYPLVSLIDVRTRVLADWHRESYLPIVALASLLGLSIGVVFARILTRPLTPTERLARAIAGDEIQPYIQPVFNLKTGKITGGEVLARWIKPNGEVVSPAAFIPLAEETGQIELLTWKLLASALGRMRPHLSADKNLTLSFNVSPAHFATPGFDQALRTRVAESKVSFRQIAIEITERQPLENLEAAVTNVRALQELGFKISIDDVGIGHSGLSHVQSLGADTLKIDKFFVDTIDSDSTAKSIVEMLVRLAARLDMSIIAEGIELDTQADALRKLGVTQGQGFLVSRPMPMDDFIRFTATPRARARAA